MKYQKQIKILSIIISGLAIIATLGAILSSRAAINVEFLSLYGEKIKLYGTGLYKNDSLSVASQALAQDWVTLIIGVPSLLIALYYSLKGVFKAKLLLTGILGYFLYTYTSYSFLSQYNNFFLLYVALMSLSFFAFVLSFSKIDLKDKIKKNFPHKLTCRVLFLIAFLITFMWLGRLMPSFTKGVAPVGLEHYTSLVIQALDLAFIVPVALITAILVRNKEELGYKLSVVVLIKGIALLTSITAMIIGQILAGVEVSIFEIILFPIFNFLFIFTIIKSLKQIKN